MASNEFLEAFLKWKEERGKDLDEMFSMDFSRSKRAVLWGDMMEAGDFMTLKYAWAIPSPQAIATIVGISREKGLVEIGCGLGYWASLLEAAGADVLAYDIRHGEKDTCPADRANPRWTTVREGGPHMLEGEACADRVLFLCYPDDFEDSDESLGVRCLDAFQGSIVVHVGELFGDPINAINGPWGRSSAPDFQTLLATDFHCVLKQALPSWPHANDHLTVWKRHTECVIQYGGCVGDEEEGGGGCAARAEKATERAAVKAEKAAAEAEARAERAREEEANSIKQATDGDEDDEDDEEEDEDEEEEGEDSDTFRYIPVDERLGDSVAPGFSHLSGTSTSSGSSSNGSSKKRKQTDK